MKSTGKLFSVLLALCCVLYTAPPVAAEDGDLGRPEGHLTVSVEKFTREQGWLSVQEPLRAPFYAGETVADVVSRLRADGAQIPDESSAAPDLSVEGAPSTDVALETSGWYCTYNNEFPDIDFSELIPQDGDALRWRYASADADEPPDDDSAANPTGDSTPPPVDRDALTALLDDINSADNLLDFLDIPEASEAYDDAYRLLQDPESTQEAIDRAASLLLALAQEHLFLTGDGSILGGLSATSDGSPVSDAFLSLDEFLTLHVPEKVSGGQGSEFSVAVDVSGWPEEPCKLIDGILSIPDGLEIVDIQMSEAVAGGMLDYHLAEDGTLRFAYLSAALEDLTIDSEQFPGELLRLIVRLTDNIPEDTQLRFSVDGFTAKSRSDSQALVFQTEGAEGTAVVVSMIAINPRVLFTGNGMDLIPDGKTAMALEFINLEGTPAIYFGESTRLFFSPQFTEQRGVTTYVTLLEEAVTEEELRSEESYYSTNETEESVSFGDANHDGVVNAQDALNALSGWLRRVDSQTDQDLLAMNVTADGQIDTFDVLAIMEHYVNNKDFFILTK